MPGPPRELDSRDVHLTIDLCLRIGELLLSNGAGAADVTATMQAVARELGLRNVETDVTFTSLAMSHQDAPEDPPSTMMRQVKHREIDYEDLTRVDHLVRDVLDGRMDLTSARDGIGRIRNEGHHTPRWGVTAAYAFMCGGVGLMLGGNAAVILIAAVAGAMIDVLQLWLSRQMLPAFYLQVVGGAVATLIAAGASALDLHHDPSLAVTANIIMLLAGIGFMGALQDALTGFYVTASARIIEAIMATAGLIAGVAAGLAVAEQLGIGLGRVDPGQPVDVDQFAWAALGAAVTAAAFGVASYCPWRVVLPIAVIAGVAVLVSEAVQRGGFAPIWGVGTAALLIGLVSYSTAGRTRVPPLVIVVSVIVPLLPGLAIFRGLALLSQEGGKPGQGILGLATAASVALALAAGVLLGEYLAQPFKRHGLRMVGPLRARAGRRFRG